MTVPVSDDPAVLRAEVTDLRQRVAELEQQLAAQQALHHTNRLRKLQRAVEQSPSSIVITDIRGAIEYVNPAFTRLTGYTLAEAQGQNPRILKSEATPPGTYRELWETIAAGKEWHGEFCNIKKNGEPFWELASVSALLDDAGQITHYIAVKEDITARKAIEQELRQAREALELQVEERTADLRATNAALQAEVNERRRVQEELHERERTLVTLLSNLPGMAYRARNDWQWTMEFVSEGCGALTGYASQRLLGNQEIAYADLIAPDDRQFVWDAVQDALRLRQPFQLTYRIITATGALRWVWEQGQGVFDHAGNVRALEGLIMDITEQQQAQTALLERETLLRETQHTAQIGGWDFDRQMHTLLWTDETYRIHEVDHDFPIITSVNEPERFYPPATLAMLQPAFARLIDTGTPFDLEAPLITGTGRSIWVRIIGKVRTQQDGHVVRVSGTIQDVTGRKQAEEALRRSEEQFRALFEQAPVGIGIARAGTALMVNPAYLRMFGCAEPAEVLGLPIEQWIVPEERASVLAYMTQRLRGEGAELRFPFTGLRKDATRFPTICDVAQVLLADGQPAMVAFFTDITELKQAEAAMRENAARVEALARIAERLNAQLDLETTLRTCCEETVRAVGITGAAVGIYDRAQDAILYRVVVGAPPELAAQIKPQPRALLEAQTRALGQVRILSGAQTRPDLINTELYRLADVRTMAHANILRADELVGVLAVFSIGSDRGFTSDELLLLQGIASQAAQAITNARLFAAVQQERASLAQRVAERTAELSLVNAELGRALRAKDEFLANMSHELRTPLNAVLGLSEALQDGVYGELDAQQLRSLQAIEESGRHLLDLINDILDLAKVEAGKIELEIGGVSTTDVCAASMRLVKQVAHKKRLRLHQNLASSITLFHADERRLKQILVNLLSNAVKFTPEGGEVGLDVTSHQENGESLICFSVWDTGIGIAPEHMDRLFKPFSQIDSSLSRPHEGTGLGLNLVARLTELHGGGVRVESTLGVGSRFTVSLPCRAWVSKTSASDDDDIPQVPGPVQVPRLGDGAPLLLLAEDNETTVRIFCDYLGARGYRVLVARNGQEAVDYAREMCPDLVLMDIQMPRIDGLEATRRIRALPELATIPIIALTALAMPGDDERCLAAGASDYLSKPVLLRQLIERIECHLG